MAGALGSLCFSSPTVVRELLVRCGVALPPGLSVSHIIRSSTRFRQLVRSLASSVDVPGVDAIAELQQCIDTVVLDSARVSVALVPYVAPARAVSEEFRYWMSLVAQRSHPERWRAVDGVRHALDVVRIASSGCWRNRVEAGTSVAALLHCVYAIGPQFVDAVRDLESSEVSTDTVECIATSLTKASLAARAHLSSSRAVGTLSQDAGRLTDVPACLLGASTAPTVVDGQSCDVLNRAIPEPADGTGPSMDFMASLTSPSPALDELQAAQAAHVSDPQVASGHELVLRVINSGRSILAVHQSRCPSNDDGEPLVTFEISRPGDNETDPLTFSVTPSLREALRRILDGTLATVRVQNAAAHSNLVVSRKGDGALVRAIGILQQGIDVRLGTAELDSLARVLA